MSNAKDGSDVAYSMLDLIMRSMRVSGVVRIDKYNASEGTADVTPVVVEERLINQERVVVPSISVKGCPVIWPQGGGRRFEFGLSKGDLCIGLFRHRSHDEVDGGSNGIIQPASDRRINVADIVVLPGFIAPSDGAPSGSYKNNGEPVLSMGDGEAVSIGQSNANYYLVREDVLNNYFSSLRSWLSSHFHSDSTEAAVTGPPSTLPVPAVPDLKSSRIKVDT